MEKIVHIQVEKIIVGQRRIILSAQEEDIFDLLLAVVQSSGCETTLRVAGGWVRDKILDRNSNDLDIALDNMYGKDFASIVNRYLESHGERAHKVGVIQSNPDQSKHLETATMKLFDHWIDLVNLRTEEYSDHSRIPTINIGTPEQDAFRRDLTINSMFYNINTNTIEDLTGKALQDLESGFIRTPLMPLDTFLDDPLRVLRSIRFASRYLYRIDPDLCIAAGHEKVKFALKTKISRERIGKELDGMLNGSRPDISFGLIFRLGLDDSVFPLPPQSGKGLDMKEAPELLDDQLWEKSFEVVCKTVRLAYGGYFQDSSRKSTMFLASALMPLWGFFIPNKKKGQPPVPLVYHLITEAVKLPNKEADDCCNIINAAFAFKRVVDSAWRSEKYLSLWNRLEVGLILREIGVLWEISLGLALATELSTLNSEFSCPHNTNFSPPHPLTKRDLLLRDLYLKFRQKVIDDKLVGVWNQKHLLDGLEIAKEIGTQQGEWLSSVKQTVLEWHILNPEKNANDCSFWIKQNYCESKPQDKKAESAFLKLRVEQTRQEWKALHEQRKREAASHYSHELKEKLHSFLKTQKSNNHKGEPIILNPEEIFPVIFSEPPPFSIDFTAAFLSETLKVENCSILKAENFSPLRPLLVQYFDPLGEDNIYFGRYHESEGLLIL